MADPIARPAADHPCPTFGRPGWQSLDGAWEFAEGAPFDRPLEASFDRTIEVPFPPESAASGLGLERCEHPRYRRTFECAPAEGNRVLLHLEGVDHEARVWVNGHQVAAHTGGYTPIVVDITDALVPGTQTVVVAAEDLTRDVEQLRGKQSWHDEPSIIWYRRSSGIWRSVWLEEVPAVRLASATWTTLNEGGHLHGEVRLVGWTEGDDLSVEVAYAVNGLPLGTVRVGATAATVEVVNRLGIAGAADTPFLYWSPDSPVLIDIRLRLLRGDEVLDEVASYTGLRTVGTRDGAIELNGTPLFQRLVLEQAFWPDSHFTAPSLEALRAEAELIKGLGFNGLRMHQVSADPRFLRICDEMGLLVWADVPAAYVFSNRAVGQVAQTLTDLVARDSNHPSVVAWVPYNESWGVGLAATDARHRSAIGAAYALAKALDPSRLAIGNDGWENVAGDFVGVHDYSHDASVLASRYGTPDAVAATVASGRPGGRVVLAAPAAEGAPVVLSEFGGVSLPRHAESWGYGAVKDVHGLVVLVEELAGAVGEASGLAGFCWTQLTDTLQEQNGLAWPDRTPKAPIEHLAAAIRGEHPVR